MKDMIKKWLEIPATPPNQNVIKELRELVTKLESELNFWKRWFKNRTPKKKCTKCKQEIELWPFNTDTTYYIKGNRVTHQKCPNERNI